jgi:uncharacterized protein YceH (UPF0502 family)
MENCQQKTKTRRIAMAKKKDVMDQLALRSDGPQLIKRALEFRNRQQEERVTAFIAGTINQAETLERQITEFQAHLKFQKDRLKAIYDGKFRISAGGNFIFEDGNLNG